MITHHCDICGKKHEPPGYPHTRNLCSVKYGNKVFHIQGREDAVYATHSSGCVLDLCPDCRKDIFLQAIQFLANEVRENAPHPTSDYDPPELP